MKFDLYDLRLALAGQEFRRAEEIAQYLVSLPVRPSGLEHYIKIRVGSPSVPGAQYGSYHRGATMLHLRGVDPSRFDPRIAGVLSVERARVDRRSPRLAVLDAPPPSGKWAFLAQWFQAAQDAAHNTAPKSRR